MRTPERAKVGPHSSAPERHGAHAAQSKGIMQNLTVIFLAGNRMAVAR